MIHNPIRKALPDLSNPGAAGDLRSGKQLVGADGAIVTGTLPEVIQATPTISVSSGGLITASATQSGGIVEGGSKSATQQLPTQGAKTVTPTTSEQTVVATGRYTTGDVVVAGDANLVPANIAQGVSIFGVTGTHSGLGKKITAHIGTGPDPMFGRTWLGVGESGVVFIMANQDYTLVAPSMIYLADTPYSENYNYSGGITQYNTGGVNYQIYYITDDFWISK